MLRLSKKSDYGLIALKHMRIHANGRALNVREISAKYHLPPDLLSKVLQRLVRTGIITSHLGSGGGYKLAKKPSEVTLKEVVQSIEGPIHFLACNSRGKQCTQKRNCTIRKNLTPLERQMKNIMASVTLKDI